MRVCPHCAEELPDDALVCTHCGKDPTVEPERSTPVRPDEEPWRPGTPGAPLSPGSPAASGLPPGAAPPPTERPVPLGRQPANTLAVLSLVVVLVSGAFGFFNWWLSMGLNVVGLVMAVVAMQQVRGSPGDRGFGFALAALILGALGLLGFLRFLT
jgi:hypothetical protein